MSTINLFYILYMPEFIISLSFNMFCVFQIVKETDKKIKLNLDMIKEIKENLTEVSFLASELYLSTISSTNFFPYTGFLKRIQHL